jgi:hypothetical protein
LIDLAPLLIESPANAPFLGSDLLHLFKAEEEQITKVRDIRLALYPQTNDASAREDNQVPYPEAAPAFRPESEYRVARPSRDGQQA